MDNPSLSCASFLVRLVEGAGWDSKLIELHTSCRWSHFEYIIPRSDGRLFTFGAQLKGGVKERPWNDPCYKLLAAFQLYRVKCTEEQYAKHFDFLLKQNKKPYDWRAIFVNFGLGRNWREQDSWFCSELGAADFEHIGLLRYPECMPVNWITPASMYHVLNTMAHYGLVEDLGVHQHRAKEVSTTLERKPD